MYDGSTATVEAVARRITKRRKRYYQAAPHPHMRGRAHYSAMSGDAVAVLPPDVFAAENLGGVVDDETSCVVVQNPDFFGNLRDLSKAAAICYAKDTLLIAVFTEVVSLGRVKPPGAMGADIAVGEGQSIGNRLNFGGPYVGLFAAKAKYLRQMPGRLCGETVDASGRRGFVLTLSTREQHIRRDKATSNICTNSGLAGLAFTIHMTCSDAGLRR
jgi:glycine dehydrogenase subunit 1